MPKQISPIAELDRIFAALADPTRRAVVERLCSGPLAVSELAQPFAMALPSFTQHLQVLEACGLVSSEKAGRVRTYRLETDTLSAAQEWMVGRCAEWETRCNQLDNYLKKMEKKS